MRILGIDPGTGRMGFGVIDTHMDGKLEMIDAGVITTEANSPDAERLEEIYSAVDEIIKLHKPHVMSIEKLFFVRNITTAMTVSQARGVALLAGQQGGLDIFEYTPLQIKQAVTGYGKADKNQVQEMVKVILKLKSIPKQDDCADALACAITHSMTANYA